MDWGDSDPVLTDDKKNGDLRQDGRGGAGDPSKLSRRFTAGAGGESLTGIQVDVVGDSPDGAICEGEEGAAGVLTGEAREPAGSGSGSLAGAICQITKSHGAVSEQQATSGVGLGFPIGIP